jgi:hypothetical protein
MIIGQKRILMKHVIILRHLKTEFERKDLDRTKIFLGLQLEHLHTDILVHQSAYVQKILEKFNMDKAYPTTTPMIVCASEKEKMC